MWFVALMNKYAMFSASHKETKKQDKLVFVFSFHSVCTRELEADFIYFDPHLHPLCAHLPWSERLLFAAAAFQTSLFTFTHLGNLKS